MTLEVIIPNFAAGGFAFGDVDPDIADAMRDAVAEQYDLETPAANDLLRLELTLDEARELVRWISKHFPTCNGTTLQKKASLFPHPASATRH